MFGYININGSILSEENKKVYQAYYCGLCRQLKADCGTKGQMMLSYDLTFLIVLLTGLYELENKETEFTCPLHPTKRRTAYINEATEYAADMNLILAYHNLVDDWKDDHSYAKKALVKILDKDYARIMKKYPRQVAALEQYMRRTEELENSGEQNLDVVSGLSGEMLSEIFCWKNDVWKEELRTLGFYMGKFIYLMDAYEDLEKEIVGMSVGESKKIRFSFPTNNLLDAEQKVIFDITVNGFLTAPQYNDIFAKECDIHAESTEKLEEHIFVNNLLCKIDEFLEETVILTYPQKEYEQMKRFVENMFRQSVEDIASNYPYMSADEYIKESMRAEMIFYALRDMIGENVIPTEKEIEEHREKQINELAKSYISTENLSESKKEMERLGEIYTYENN